MSKPVDLVREQTPSFLADSVDLKATARLLKAASKPAVDALLACLESSDERIKLSAASKLLEYGVDVAKAVSQDQLQRLVAEIKLKHNPTNRLIEDNKPTNTVLVDFSTIREID